MDLFAIEYNKYEMESEHVFNASHFGHNDENDIGVNLYPGGEDSLGPGLFFIKKQIIISDQSRKKNRTIYLNNNYSFDKIFEKSFVQSTVYNFINVALGNRFNKFISIYNIEPYEPITFLSYSDFHFLSSYRDVYYQDNTLFVHDKNFKLWAIRNPGMDTNENRKNVISEEYIIKEIKSGKYEGLTIDDKKRLFKDGELQTVNIKRFFEYYNEQISDPLPILNKKNKENFYIRNNAVYLGRDEQGFTYWYDNNRVLVVDDNHTPINDILLTKEFMLYTNPAISPKGDIFFLDYGTDKVTLYKIKRQW